MAAEIELATGVVLLIFGLSFLLNADYWSVAFRGMLVGAEYAFPLLLVLLVLGVILVNAHNLWVADWRVIVTVTGWGLLVKSIVALLAPATLRFDAQWTERLAGVGFRLGGAVWSIAGGVVTYFSWQ